MKRLFICLAVCAFLPQPLIAQERARPSSPKKVRVNGVELHYVDEGTGVPVVFVHGGLEDYRAWQPQMAAFSQRHRTIAYSRRHNYPNARVAPGSHYSAAVDADDLAALIKKLGLAPAHVVGVSYGAYGALFLAARHPALVRSLVLSEPPLLRWLPDMEGGKALFTQFMSAVWEPAARGFRVGDEAGLKAAIDGFGQLGYAMSSERITFSTLPPEIRSLLLENAPEWKALTASRDAFPALSLEAVKRIKVPTLMLSGQHTLALHKVIDGQLERLLPQRERIVLANASHEMWNEVPEECGRAALAFFARH